MSPLGKRGSQNGVAILVAYNQGPIALQFCIFFFFWKHISQVHSPKVQSGEGQPIIQPITHIPDGQGSVYGGPCSGGTC